MASPNAGEWTIVRDFMADWGAVSRQNKVIYISWDALAQNYDFVLWLIHHELGHVVGLDHGGCARADSVMTPRQPSESGIVHVGCADIRQLQQNCAPPPPSSCPDNCNYADPCPVEPEQPEASCPIMGPTDYCAYPGSGCPFGEEVSQYGSCCYQFNSPILIDLGGDGFHLTGLDAGVIFSIGPVVRPYRVSWTRPFTNDAWLVLDRDGNGTIDTGSELFGNFTPQPQPPGREMRHGFRALAVFDTAADGGNRDGAIGAEDLVFSKLRLWRDMNHNGLSETSELSTLAANNIAQISLDYKDSKYTDSFGNVFRFRAKLRLARGGQATRWAYDVFLKGRRQ